MHQVKYLLIHPRTLQIIEVNYQMNLVEFFTDERGVPREISKHRAVKDSEEAKLGSIKLGFYTLSYR